MKTVPGHHGEITVLLHPLDVTIYDVITEVLIVPNNGRLSTTERRRIRSRRFVASWTFADPIDIRNPQNAAWLAGFRYAKKKVFV